MALDIDAVQAFVLVADLKSFTRAAEIIDTTQSAVSLKIKRLEDSLGRRLLERTPRKVRLSAEGSTFLGAARTLLQAHEGAMGSFAQPQQRLVVGISHHIVGAELPILLKHLKRTQPNLQIEMHISTSRDIRDAFDRGLLGGALVLGYDNRRQDGEVMFHEQFAWMAADDFEQRPGEPLRLATQPAPCSMRAMATSLLDEAGIAWSEVFVGGGMTTIGAAVSAGLAVAAMARRVAPAGLVDIGARLGLPPLPSREVILYCSASTPQVRSVLHSLAAAVRTTASAA